MSIIYQESEAKSINISGFIYKITNIINQKVYVGQTILDINKRFKQHMSHPNRRLKQAILEVGTENFKIELLKRCFSQRELDNKEMFYISKFKSAHEEFGYNISLGGHGKGKHSTATKTKMSISVTGKKKSKIHRLHISESKKGKPSGREGTHLSRKTRKQMSKSKKGKLYNEIPNLKRDLTRQIKKTRKILQLLQFISQICKGQSLPWIV